MKVVRIKFTNFRNFQSLDLRFDQGFVILTGPNGAGKTNFLEGIYFALSLERFPTSALNQLFQDGETFFRLEMTGAVAAEETKFEVFCEQQEARTLQQLKINGQVVSRSQFMRKTAVISFLPEDLNLLTHSPVGRRSFFDETLTALSPEYRRAFSQYNKALKQRNLALEQKVDLDIWDEQLANFGSVITAFREGFIKFAGECLKGILENLSPDLADIQIVYRNSGAADKSQFVAALISARARDIERLTTSVGPHRDDFEMFENNRTIAGWLSRGQLRTLTLALKMLEKQYLEQELGQTPLMLLDDVFSEFDSGHQQHLLEFLKGFEQVFLTTAHLEELKDHLPANSQVYNVKDGKIDPLPRRGEG